MTTLQVPNYGAHHGPGLDGGMGIVREDRGARRRARGGGKRRGGEEACRAFHILILIGKLGSTQIERHQSVQSKVTSTLLNDMTQQC